MFKRMLLASLLIIPVCLVAADESQCFKIGQYGPVVRLKRPRAEQAQVENRQNGLSSQKILPQLRLIQQKGLHFSLQIYEVLENFEERLGCAEKQLGVLSLRLNN